MASKSPRRSPNRRLHNFSSHSPKTRRLWYNTNLNYPRPTNKKHSLSIYYTFFMRHSNDQLNLSPPNRPKIFNCLFICQSYSPSHCRHYNSNTMKFYRSYSSNNRPWSNLITPILSSKYQLWTNPQPNHNYSSRPTNNLPTNSHMMTISKSSQPSPSTTN